MYESEDEIYFSTVFLNRYTTLIDYTYPSISVFGKEAKELTPLRDRNISVKDSLTNYLYYYIGAKPELKLQFTTRLS